MLKAKVDEMDRKEITATLGEHYANYGRTTFIAETMDWNGYTLDEMIKRIEEIRNTYSATFKDIKIDKDTEYTYEGEPRIVWNFVGRRMETDAEWTKRTDEIKARKADQEARDRAEFERLKAKFG